MCTEKGSVKRGTVRVSVLTSWPLYYSNCNKCRQSSSYFSFLRFETVVPGNCIFLMFITSNVLKHNLTFFPGGGGEGVLPKIVDRGVPRRFSNPDPI